MQASKIFISALLVTITLNIALAAGEGSSPSATPKAGTELGFWEIGISEFEAGKPLVIPSPVPGSGVDFYYVWPFSLRNSISLKKVLRHYQQLLASVKNDERQRALLQRSIEMVTTYIKKVEAGVARQSDFFDDSLKDVVGQERLRLHISLHADTGTSYPDLANRIIAKEVSRKLGRKYLTTLEISMLPLKVNQQVYGVAIFPEIDTNADRFEVRVMGLGKRISPSYYPGHLMKLGTTYDAKLRKAIRFFYTRPGDPLRREIDTIELESKQDEWVWMWQTEMYPLESDSFTVKRSQGLEYDYRYFPYEVFNSTPDLQTLSVRRAGLAPLVKWHGMRMLLNMTEDVKSNDFWQNQAVRTLKKIAPAAMPVGGPRHVDGAIEPGKKAMGVAIMRWGIEHPEIILGDIIAKVRIHAMTATSADKADPLIAAYLGLDGGSTADAEKSVFMRSALPSDTEVKKLVLAQAEKELAADGTTISEKQKERYGDLAPLAVLMNSLADKEIQRLQGAGRIPVYFEVDANTINDESRIERLFAAGRPEERDINTTIEIIEPEKVVGESNSYARSGETGTTSETTKDPWATPGETKKETNEDKPKEDDKKEEGGWDDTDSLW